MKFFVDGEDVHLSFIDMVTVAAAVERGCVSLGNRCFLTAMCSALLRSSCIPKTNFERCRESRSGVTLSNLNSNDDSAFFAHSTL